MNDAERDRRSFEIFDQALELPTDEVDAFVDQACAGDEELRRSVEDLLAADRRAAGGEGDIARVLAGDALSLVEETLGPQASAASNTVDGPTIDGPTIGGRRFAIGVLEGDVVGDYRIGRSLGVGGMGHVFEAERVDGTLDRAVALKLLSFDDGETDDAGLRSADATLREARALAALRHPHIARVFDVGTTETGQPFLVMERIDGVPLPDYCRAHHLDLERRVDLMIQLCDAVHAAHERQIVHRDLKPSNVLVEAPGQVKLLDFGIAHRLDGDGRDPLRRRMTPAYAAPEQARGERVTQATDVYALGLLLYEVFTGQRAIQLRAGTATDLIRQLWDTEPPPPSLAFGDDTFDDDTAATMGTGAAASGTPLDRLRRALRGDLDNIVMKALRKPPGRRYPDAGALAEDLRRWRRGEPVQARPLGRLGRFGKLVRRRPWTSALFAALALLLLGSTAYLRVQRHQAVEELERAEAEAETAQEVAGLIRWLFESSQPSESFGVDAPADELLRSGVERAEESPVETRPELYRVLAGAFAELGHADEAAELEAKAAELEARGASETEPQAEQEPNS